MTELIRFAFNIHIPLFILGQLLFANDLPQNWLLFLLSLNIVFVLTSATYLCVLTAKQNFARAPLKLHSRKRTPPIVGVLVGWLIFFIVFSNYIEGVSWVSVGYVVVVTWLPWFFSLRKKNDIQAEEMHPIGLLAYELLTVTFAIIGGYALYDGAFIVYESWVWVALVFVNISLLLNESVYYLNRKNILSKKMVANIIVTYITLLSIPTWVVLLFQHD